MPQDESLFSLTGALGKGKGKLAAVGETSAPGDEVMEQLDINSEDEEVGSAGPVCGLCVGFVGAALRAVCEKTHAHLGSLGCMLPVTAFFCNITRPAVPCRWLPLG
jgi:hypothetical protein